MTSTVLIRVSTETRDKLARIAATEHTSIGDVAAEVAERLERDRFWKNYRESFAELKSDPEGWADYQRERAEWDAIAGDRLHDYPYEDNAEADE